MFIISFYFGEGLQFNLGKLCENNGFYHVIM